MIENEDENEDEDENVCRTCVNLHNCSTNEADGSKPMTRYLTGIEIAEKRSGSPTIVKTPKY